MKHKILVIVMALLPLLSFGGTHVVWNETTHNFGAFDEDDGSVTFDFVFTNTSRHPIAITAARASCGCTAPRFSTASVAPGDSGVISVTYNPQGRPGRFDKFVAVEFSEPDDRIKLHIVGTVIGSRGSVSQRYPVECGDYLRFNRGAVMLGDVMKDRVGVSFLSVYNAGYDTLRPEIREIPDFMTARFEPAEIAPGEQSSLMVYLNSRNTPLYGLIADSIEVAASAEAVGCVIPVTAIVKEDFTRLTPGQMKKAPVARFSSTTADFGQLGNEPIERTLTLHNDGKSTLIIRRIYTTDPRVTVSCDRTSIAKGKSAVITVRVNPLELPGRLLNARISVITNDPMAPTQNVRAVGVR